MEQYVINLLIELCKGAKKLYKLGFIPVRMNSYFVRFPSSEYVILEITNNLEFHFSDSYLKGYAIIEI